MGLYGKERCERIAEYMIENGATVRQCATCFSISKSTVHKDLTGKLYYINRKLYEEAKKILEKNKSERHLRGGEATRQKYIRQKEYIHPFTTSVTEKKS